MYLKRGRPRTTRSILHGLPFYYIGESLRSVFLFAQRRGRGSSVARDSPRGRWLSKGRGRGGGREERGREGEGPEVTSAVVLLTERTAAGCRLSTVFAVIPLFRAERIISFRYSSAHHRVRGESRAAAQLPPADDDRRLLARSHRII